MLEIRIDSTALRAEAKLDGAESVFKQANKAGLDAVGRRGVELNEENLQRDIYDQPLPESMAKRGLVRTGALKAGQTMVLVSENKRLVSTRKPVGPFGGKDPTEYADWRYGYDTLPAKWPEETVAQLQQEAQDVYERAASRVIANYFRDRQ